MEREKKQVQPAAPLKNETNPFKLAFNGNADETVNPLEELDEVLALTRDTSIEGCSECLDD